MYARSDALSSAGPTAAGVWKTGGGEGMTAKLEGEKRAGLGDGEATAELLLPEVRGLLFRIV